MLVVPTAPCLRARSLPVTLEELKSPEFQDMIYRIQDFVIQNKLESLAAPEVGVMRRIIFQRFVRDIDDDVRIYINPSFTITDTRKSFGRELCVTAGNLGCKIKRPNQIAVKSLNSLALNVDFVLSQKWEVHSFLHAYDHLDGIRFPIRTIRKDYFFIRQEEMKAFLEGEPKERFCKADPVYVDWALNAS